MFYCQILLSNFVVKKWTVQTFTLLYLTLLVYLQLWYWIKIQSHRKENWVPQKYECQKLQTFYTQVDAVYGSVCILVKTSHLSVSKMRQFLHSKTSYTKITLATRQFKRMKAVVSFQNELRCMDVGYVDKLAKDKIGVKFLLVRQGLFDRTVDAKGMKTKVSIEMVCAFFTMITKKMTHKSFGRQRNRICWRIKERYAKLKEYKLTLSLWIQVLSKFVSIRYNPEFQKKLLDRLDTKKCQGF